MNLFAAAKCHVSQIFCIEILSALLSSDVPFCGVSILSKVEFILVFLSFLFEIDDSIRCFSQKLFTLIRCFSASQHIRTFFEMLLRSTHFLK